MAALVAETAPLRPRPGDPVGYPTRIALRLAPRPVFLAGRNDLLTGALPGDPQQPANWPAYAALLPHARAALPLSSTQMMDMAGYLGYSGSYAAARDLSQQILDAREQVSGAEHPSTVAARANLAYWTGAADNRTGD